MKNILYLLLVTFVFASCKSSSNIVTSKTEAQRKGTYKLPNDKKIAAKKPVKKNEPKANEIKKVVAKDKINEANDDDYTIHVDNSSYLVKQLINAASDHLGASYRSGGTTSEGFDCSGLMYSTFKKFDISLPRSSVDMAKKGRKLNNNEIQKGDLIFFKTNGKSVINHVGMVVEVNNEEIKFIHSSTSSGVIISSTKELYYGRTFAQANRIIE